MPLTLPQNFSDVLDYRHVLWKRKWTVLLCTALVLLFTGYRVYKEVPVYTSSARILLSYRPPEALDMQGVFVMNPWQMQRQQDTTGATLALLSSRMLAERVIEKLDLAEDSPLAPVESHGLRYYLGSLVPESTRRKIKGLFLKTTPADPSGGGSQSEPGDSIKIVVDNYLSSLKVQPTETGLLLVAFSGTDPEQLQKILNTHLQEFVKLDLEVKFETSEEAQEWIEQKLKDAKHRMEVAGLTVLQFAEEHDMPPLREAFGPPDDFAMTERSVAEYKDQIRRSQLGIEFLQRLLENPDIIETLPGLREESPTLGKLKADLLQLSATYNSLSIQYGPDHPKMVRLRNQIRNMKQQIREEAQRLIRSMETQVAFASAMLQTTREDQVVAMQELRHRSDLKIQFDALNSEVESSRKVYEEVLAKLNLVKLMGNMQDGELMSTIKVIDKPQPAVPLYGGSRLNKIVKAGGMGFILGIAVAFLLEFLDNVVRTPKDIQRFIQLPFLGFIPRLVSAQKMKKDNRGRSFVTILEPSSSEAESIRNVRTNLIFSFADRRNHAVMFTSPNEMEGKSTVISQLAASISQLSKNTLLVDTDLRRPTLHKIMRVENTAGVSDILIGETTLDQAIHETGISNLSFLSAGTIPPNPSELLGSESMKQLIEELKTRYDVILFDSPPILPVVDAKVLGSLMDGVCIVPRSGKTTLTSLNQAIQQMEERTIRLLGIVLNHLDLAEFATHYGYTYGYYQSTGEPEEEISIPPATSS